MVNIKENLLKGGIMGVGFLLVLSIASIVYAVGFHQTSEVLPGMFQGDYSFNGSITVNDNLSVEKVISGNGSLKIDSDMDMRGNELYNADYVDVFHHHVTELSSGVDTTSSSFVTLSKSVKTVNFSEGTAVMDWSISSYSNSGSGDYKIRSCIKGICGGKVSLYTNEVDSHKTYTGHWARNVTAGEGKIKLQVLVESGSWITNHDDHLSWNAIVYKE